MGLKSAQYSAGYLSVEKIAHIRLKLHKVLPAVYDESLSYLEGLAKLTFKVNETIEAVNVLNDNVDLLNDSVNMLNDRVTAVEGEIEGFEAEVTARVDQLERDLTAKIDDAVLGMEAKVDAKLATVDGKLNEMDERIDALEIYVRDTLDRITEEFRVIIQAEIDRIEQLYSTLEADLKAYVEEEVAKVIEQIPDLTNIYVISPASGKLVKVQQAINDIFYFNLYYALTCDEFNECGLTCDEINDIMVNNLPRGMTVKEWLHDAKKILIDRVPIDVFEKWVQPHSIVRHFLNGTKVWLEKNTEVNEGMWAWSGSFTCDELVTLGFDVDAIIAFNISCEDYIMRANEIMVSA